MNILRFVSVFLVLLLAFMTGQSSVFAAATIDNMYEALVPLEDRTVETRQAALQVGLEQVLVRYSGETAVGGLEGMSEALENAESYVVEFSVETREVAAPDGLSTNKSQFLWVRYNASQVDQLAQTYQLPVWPSLRPTVRYIVMEEVWGRPNYMSRDKTPAMFLALESLFDERGLPADTFEPRFMGANRVWDLSEVDGYALLNEANADVLMVVRMLEGRLSGTRSEIVVVQKEDISVLKQETGSAIFDASLSLNKFVDSVALEQAFIANEGEASEVFVNFVGVDGFGSYRRFLNVLSDIDQVTDAHLEASKGDQMMFRVAYGGNHDRLISSIQRQIDVEQLRNQYQPSGTKLDPYLLAVPGYQFPERIQPIFSEPALTNEPAIDATATPIRESEPLEPLDPFLTP